MQKYKNLNQISDKLQKLIPPFEREVVFELLNGHKDPTSGIVYYGGALGISLRDKILDEGKIVEIGVPETFNGELVKRCKKFKLENTENGRVGARFSLQPDRLEDHEIYEFFMLCNINQSSVNPSVDRRVKKLFKVINEEADAKTYNLDFNAKLTAMKMADQMNLADMKMLLASMSRNVNKPENTIKQEVFKYAEEQPAEFMKRLGDDATKYKAEIYVAKEKGVIAYDVVKNNVMWSKSGAVIAQLDKSEKDWVDNFYDWIAQSKNGKSVMDQITKAVAAVLKGGGKNKEEKKVEEEVN